VRRFISSILRDVVPRTQNVSEYMLVLTLCLVMVALCNRADHCIFMLFLLMVALWNRADHYIFMLRFVLSSSSFFSSPNLSRHRLDVYHTSAHGVVLCKFRMQV